MTYIYFWTILAYMVFLVGVGAIRSRGVKDQEGFPVAGRQRLWPVFQLRS